MLNPSGAAAKEMPLTIELHVGIPGFAYIGQDLKDLLQRFPGAKVSPFANQTDVVVVTWGALVQRSIVAAHQAEKEGVSVAILDLRTLVPYDWNAIAAYVKRTNRVIVAHEDQLMCGFGAEIAIGTIGYFVWMGMLV